MRLFSQLADGLEQKAGVRLVRFSEKGLLRQARLLTGGLSDFGDEGFRTPLRLLCEYFDETPDLTPVGRVLQKGTLFGQLRNRLRIRHYLARHPEVKDERIRRPLFVVALPRTGTTLLFNLLAQDPAARPLLHWEALDPVPPRRRPAERSQDPRIARAEKLIGKVNRALPAARKVHPIHPRGPEECIPLLANAFLLFLNHPQNHAYWKWLETMPDAYARQAYAEYKEQLQLLQHQHAGEHWVLKSPMHLYGLKELLETFPDACVVQTHRDPLNVVASTCSLHATILRASIRDVDPHAIGRHVMKSLSLLLARSLHAREHHGDRIYDVRYDDLVRDPMGTVHAIYDRFGYAHTAPMDARMKAYLAANPKNKHGRHRYRLETFGIDPEDVYALFRRYYEQLPLSVV